MNVPPDPPRFRRPCLKLIVQSAAVTLLWLLILIIITTMIESKGKSSSFFVFMSRTAAVHRKSAGKVQWYADKYPVMSVQLKCTSFFYFCKISKNYEKLLISMKLARMSFELILDYLVKNIYLLVFLSLWH